MKKTLHKFVIPPLVALLLIAWPGIVNAQVSAAGLRTPPPSIDPVTGLPRPPEMIDFNEPTLNKRVNLNLDGVPIAEVVEMLRSDFTNVNFILTPGVKQYDDPGIFLKLRSAGLREILSGIYFATDKQVEYEVQSPTLLAFVSAKQKSAEGPDASPASPPPALKPTRPPVYQILNLRDVLRVKDRAKIDEILKTVDEITRNTLAELYGGSGKDWSQFVPRLNYHPGSGVLVIVGQQEGLELVNQVIRNLRIRDEERGGSGGPDKLTPSKEPVPPKAPVAPAPAKPDSSTP